VRLWVGIMMVSLKDTCNILAMNVLFLDTASLENSLAFCNEKKVLTHRSIEKLKSDSELIPMIEDCMKEIGITYKDLTHLACTIGPGGFTSLRIGIATINTLSYALGIPSVGIHLSDLLEVRVLDRVRAFWLHSTRRTQLFAKNPDSDEIKLLSIDDAKNLKCSYIGELIEDHKQALPNCTPLPGDQFMTLEEVLPSFLSGLSYSNDQLMPWYGRDS